METVILTEGLTKRFGNRVAVDGIDLAVRPGEVFGFLGPNGAGKTTTMRILTGYMPPSAGSASIAGHDVFGDSLAARRNVGYLPESVPLYPEMSVGGYLEYMARLRRLPSRRAAVQRAMELVHIADRARDRIGKLSKGYRQRVGLAQALLHDPPVLILDEPTSGLDPLQRVEVRGLIREVARERTVLVSSHILPEVEAVADRIVILHRGRIAAQGTRAELVSQHAGGSSVRLEAFVRDPAEAARLLRTLPGVSGVTDTGRLGIHHGFDVLCDGDLREDVGALAAAKGWALRELSFKRPSLEELFARIALELETPAAAPPGPPANGGEAAPVLVSSLPLSAPAAPQKRQVYNLNPFEQGGQRDLSAPKDPEAR
jgi:ABC-2 type transport system ATP-binding protein